MREFISKKRRQLEKELLFYLRKYKFFTLRFKNIKDLESIINEIIEELKTDI